MGYQVGNVYVIAAVAVVGGALFGFDISSMSAIISTEEFLCYFNQGPLYLDTDGKCSGPTPNVSGKQALNPGLHIKETKLTRLQVVSSLQCPLVHGWDL
jgi:hypothetical protein